MLKKLQKPSASSPSDARSVTQKNWYADRYQSVLVQRNMLSIVSLLALVFSTLAIFAVYRNIPIVTVEPFVIQVEPRSGITQVVRPASARELAANEAVTRFFIVRYIKARENFDAAIRQNFNIVRLSSDPSQVFRSYAWEMNPNNPSSFVARNGPKAKRKVGDIRSISKLDKNPVCIDVICSVQIRVRIEEMAPGSTTPAISDKIILMEYMFTTLNLTVEERYINPIGFRVVSYRVDNEAS